MRLNSSRLTMDIITWYNLDLPPEEFEAKRPDFTWSIQDVSASSGRLEGCREFVVECKRIGNEEGGTNFNHRYVDLGKVASSVRPTSTAEEAPAEQ